MQALAADGAGLLGTSHRQPPVKNLVRDVREGLAELFAIPAGYEVVLGNGGSTFFWDVATFSLIERRSAHASFGEFSAKFAAAAAAAPHLDEPSVVTAEVGSVVLPSAVAGADVYAWAHNETSTGAIAPVQRIDGADPDALVVVDGTSAAGGTRSTSRPPTSTTSRRRRTSARTAASGWRSCRRPRSIGWPGSPPPGAGSPTASACRSRSTTRG